MLKKVVSIIILIILIPILFVNGVILINSFMHPDEIPSFFGWKPFIVLSGSMEKVIYPGDLAVVKEIDTKELKEQDVIAFKENNVVITHRIIQIIEEDGNVKYITKGDNNSMVDNGAVKPEQVEGIFKFRIARLGNLAMFIQTPIGMIISLSIPIGMLLIIQKYENDNKKKEEKEVQKNKEKNLEEEIERLKKQNEELMKK